MTLLFALRLVAAPAAILAGRAASRRTLPLAGLLAGFAAFGLAPPPAPPPVAMAVGVFVLLLLGTGALQPRWIPITGEGALAAALFGAPAAAVAGLSARGGGAWAATACMAAVLAAFSLGAAGSLLAIAEVGGRRWLLFGGAFVVPPALAALASEVEVVGRGKEAAVAAVSLAVALLAWLPVVLVERHRVSRELEEEVRLGLLPAEDAHALELPWRRGLEPRFGRADERREYVRSALLLAVARAQQRRRSGEAERLRQLEILTFRTRLRRTLEARAVRQRRPDSLELPAVGNDDRDAPGGRAPAAVK